MTLRRFVMNTSPFARRSTATALRLDQAQRFPAHEDLRVVALAPAERRDIEVLADRAAAVTLAEAGPERRAYVRVGAAIQQQTREARRVRFALAVVDPEPALRDDRREERSVPAEAVRVDRRPRVRIHAPVE